ncbi:hypothetical protein [Microbacterium jejuense]|uniref:hypothetical protein n=1 Tax=Microbacterium jejuense TaxID=1263637 RepID=UPI0031F09C75
MSADRRPGLDDDAALARYLVALRDSGSALTPELAAAFDELTPGQLDVLVGLLIDAAELRAATGPGPRPWRSVRETDAAPTADGRPWPLRAWVALLVGASLVTGALVWAADVALDGPADGTSVVAERGDGPIDLGDLGIDLTGLDDVGW